MIIEERLDFGVLIFSLYITPALPILWLSLHHYTRLYIPSDDFSALPTPRSFFFLHFAMSAKLSMGDAWEEDWESQADVSFTRPATSPIHHFLATCASNLCDFPLRNWTAYPPRRSPKRKYRPR